MMHEWSRMRCDILNYNYLSYITVEREHLTIHLSFHKNYLNHKYILINDKLQYDLDLISSKHWDVTGYTFANI